MKLLDLRRAQGADDPGAALVERFFARLCAEDGAGAGRLAAPRAEWFGRAVEAQEWSSAAFTEYLRAEPMTCASIRAVPEDLLAYLRRGSEATFDGPLDPNDAVYLADVRRGARTVTCGLVLRDVQGELRVARVFEPSALADALRGFGADHEA